MAAVIGVIPARYASSRFPGKPLIKIAGKSMIQRVYEQANKAQLLNQVIVATDDERIFQEVHSFGGNVQLTDPNHPSGTNRCAEIAKRFQDIEAIVNIQGDEPFIDPLQIDLLINSLFASKSAKIATLAKKIIDWRDFLNPNIVKVVFNKKKEALYFSRSPIPYTQKEQYKHLEVVAYKHIGIYAYDKATLLEISSLPTSPLAKRESLEQLTWLEQGHTIAVELTEQESISIDTPADLEEALKWLATIKENYNE